MTTEIQAQIHHYFPHPDTGTVEYDEDGDPIIGFYYEFICNGMPIMEMMGPYPTLEEAQAACEKAWDEDDF